MTGRILHINTSPGGLPKRPRLGDAELNELGVIGDDHAHPQFHGGPKKAVLLIGIESINELKGAGFPVFAGAMGENLTTEGLDRRAMRLGQKYSVGTAILQLTSMRIPCTQLDVYGPEIKRAVFDSAVKAGDASSPRWGLAGFYAAVIQPGVIRPNDTISLLETERAAAQP